jgi:peptidylprolyl isomerase
MRKILYSFLFTAYTVLTQAQTLSKETVVIETDFGKIKLKLYEETPLHKANFLKLVQSGFYDSLLFHRIIANFMIQGGDPDSKLANDTMKLGDGDLKYRLPAEIHPQLIHKKGALAAARDGDDVNPKFESSACQFYIVQGKIRSKEDLANYEKRINKTRYANTARAYLKSEEGQKQKQIYDRLKSENKSDSATHVNQQIEQSVKAKYAEKQEYQFSAYQTDMYSNAGGTPHLDGTYTVFGEVIEGLLVLDRIAAVKTDKNDRPLQNVRMKMYIK